MKAQRRILLALALVTFAVTASAAAAGQSQKQSATDFYMSYKAAFRKATKMEDLFPYMSKEKLAELKGASAADLRQLWEMSKDLYVFTNEKVVKETLTATGATLDVEAVDADKKKYKATVTLVKEANAWKFQEESWTPAE